MTEPVPPFDFLPPRFRNTPYEQLPKPLRLRVDHLMPPLPEELATPNEELATPNE